MSLVRLRGVGREIGALSILDSIDAAVAAGERIGLVGANGAGKTTLLRIIAGAEEPDRGVVERRRGLTMGLLGQEAQLDEAFMSGPDLRTAVRGGAGDLVRMEEELSRLEHAGRALEPAYADLRHRFETREGYSLDQRVEEVLSGLGFRAADLARPPNELSGGQQTRAALAGLLIANPDLLLLDEPTNHLDLAAIEWLEANLSRRGAAFIVTSHDRAFLDGAVTRIWELRDGRLTAFRGAYSAYARQREERDARQRREAAQRESGIAREQELIQRYRSHRKYSKMHEHEARLERLARIEVARTGRALALDARPEGSPPAAEVAVRIDDLVLGYLGVTSGATPGAQPRVVLRAPNLLARRGERIGIVGPNGAGKTTLLRAIAGELAPLDGRCSLGSGVALGYLTQVRTAALPGETVLDALLAGAPTTPSQARSYLARFLFRGDDVLKEVRRLSGGERSRLELALLGLGTLNLLLLDEPTNHLDIPAREALESFLRESPATVLIISHDRRLLEIVCETLWVIDGGLAVPFAGPYREWRAAVADGWTPAGSMARSSQPLGPEGVTPGSLPRPRSGTRPRGPDGSGTQAESRGNGIAPHPAGGPRTKPPRLSKDAYRRQKALVEGDLTRLGLRRNHLEVALHDPDVAATYVELRRITSELADVDQALAAAEEAWLLIEERAP